MIVLKQVSTCDIGCCCDVDCSTEDRKVFSHCSDFRPSFPSDPHLCHRAQWWYKENTAYGGIQYHGGLLCLHTDNLPDRHWLDNPKVIQLINLLLILNTQTNHQLITDNSN
jgi:hypothetical protein